MLRNLELNCFMAHEKLSVSFTEGLNVCRGANESGKSSMLIACAYALFGTKALRTSLADAVTWGHKETELSVSLDLELEGQTYRFQRSKRGAEVSKGDQVFVTGQNEVSAFASNLLGAEVGTAVNLMLAGQGGLRGALEKGPKATAEMIEQLADFNLFDQILDRAQEKLPLGSTAVLEDRLKALDQRLAEIQMPEEPDTVKQAEVQYLAEARIADRNRYLIENVGPAHQLAYDAWDAECRKRQRGRELQANMARVSSQIQDTKAQRAEAEPTAQDTLLDVDALQRVLTAATQAETRYADYQKFLALPNPPRMVRKAHNEKWEISKAEVARLEKEVREADTSRRVAEAKLVTSSVCGLCGQDVSQFPEAAEKNRQIRVEMAHLEEVKAEAEETLLFKRGVLEGIVEYSVDEGSLLRAVRGLEGALDRDDDLIPATFTWKGEVPEAGMTPERIDGLRSELKRAQAHNAAVVKAQAQVEAFDKVLARNLAEADNLAKQYAELELLSEDQFKVLDEGYMDAAGLKADVEDHIKRLQAELQDMVKAHADALKTWDDAVRARAQIQEQITTTEKDIAAIQFNNTLIKKVRTARPIIANKLWNLVLTSVSNLFSRMRGEPSAVTKGEAGFLVNGQAMESLSGSTLDLLGLAIRVALVKTFLPSCPLLVLDEPTAACDYARTANLIGFVAAAGFQQVILVTHEDTSEALASNLIQL